MMPVRCKFCGCDAIRAESLSIIYFMCNTVFWPDENDWNVSHNCAVKYSAQSAELRERVKRAVEVLETATRFDFVASYMPHMDKRSDGEFMEYEQAEQALEILKGETDGKAD